MSDEEDKTNKQKSYLNSKIFKELAPYMNLGIQMAVTIGLGALAGWWLDGKFDTKPIFVLIFSLLGVFLAMYNFFRIVFDLEKKKKNGKKN